MKTKTFERKLVINKQTISNLNDEEMNAANVKGGLDIPTLSVTWTKECWFPVQDQCC